jgi:hypothetical protein
LTIRPSLALVAVLATTACSTLQQYSALQDVDFSLAGVSDVRLAGVNIDEAASAQDLGLVDAGRLLAAIGARDLPLELTVDVGALNPADNGTDARLMRMDWTLLLEGRETLSGVFDDEVVLPPGQPRIVPVGVSLDLFDFFEGSGQDLVELAMSLTGSGGVAKNVALRITPVIDTPLGSIRYPPPITLFAERVGGPGAF